MNIINAIEQEVVAKNEGKLSFSVGDTVKVYFKIVEGTRERIQAYEGLVIAINNSGIRTTFVVRKIAYGVGVERIFPVYSPRVEKVEVIRKGRVRRAKLYYIRKKLGKRAKVKELIRKKEVSTAEKTPVASN
ncbi:MAG: 50S ribosomal protein L19 [Sphaerochaetaceae bacterium]|nr:50S ribosomal protein L19 [Sphaerochaetaceae bacterium]